MSKIENNLPDPSSGETDGDGNVKSVSITDTINKATGREYKTDEEALKGISETSSYVGKVGKYKEVLEGLEKEHGSEKATIDFLKTLKKTEKKSDGVNKSDENFITKEEYMRLEQDRSFYEDNPSYKPYKDLLKNLKGKDSLEETVKREDVKEILSKLVSHDKSQKSKSVIHSNPRVSSEDKESYRKDLAKAKQTGKWTEFFKKHKGIEF